MEQGHVEDVGTVPAMWLKDNYTLWECLEDYKDF
jgi:hypothetical protein